MGRLNVPFNILALLLAMWGMGCSHDPAPTKPEPTRFTQTVVADGLDEPFQLEFDDRGHVYWIERGGAIKRIQEATGRTDVLGTLPLYEGKAPGLIGVLLDDDFAQTRQLYVYYSAAEAKGDMRLSRFTLGADETIDMDSEMVLLTIPWEQPDGSHFGGGMAWDAAGNLYLSVGGDTPASQYEPIHRMNEGRRLLNGARTAGSTNDLRGTILRITPQPDGRYTIPDGNLFSADTPNTRPEIYVMGTRNPWRLSIDSQTGYLHWGEVGPDAGADSDTHGPMGYDEFNVARSAGNFGWPFVVGMNRPYHQYDYSTKTYGAPYDPQSPINDAPNNTGLRELPAARPPLVAYPYKVSETWPVLGSAARSAVGGPIFHRADFDDAPRVFPPYFEDKWLVTDYVRNWIMVITMNPERTAATHIERLVPSDRLTHKQPLDMDYGPTGDLYVVEYGRGGQGRLSKITYNDGNRPPQARANAERTSGAVPFQLALSSEGTVDYDGDALHYAWTVAPSGGGSTKQFTGAAPTVTLEQPGRYDVVLTVRDPEGATDRDSVEVVAGNERPMVDIEITDGNRSFYFPDSTIAYTVRVQDHEDGSLHGSGISDDRVTLTAEYLPSGLSPAQLTELLPTGSEASPQMPLRHLQAQAIIAQGTCRTCHRMDEALVGPSFRAVAERYASNEAAKEILSRSLTEGSSGTWGESAMPPQTTLSEAEVTQVVDYILSLNSDAAQHRLPLQSTFTTEGHPNEGGNTRLHRFFDPGFELGAYVLRARYTDKGRPDVEGLVLHGEDRLLLRPPFLGPETADVFSEDGISYTPSSDDPGFIVSGPEAYLGFDQIDLTGIREIHVGALTRFWHWSHFVGGTVELRLGAPDGRLVGEPHRQFRPDSITAADGPFFGDDLDPPVRVDVSGVRGVHDVYVVFRNPDAGSDDALLVITGLAFKP